MCPDRSAVEVEYILRIHFSDSAGYTTSTLQLDGSIYAVCSYTVLTGYPSHGSIRHTACTVYTAATLYCWQWTCSIYCTPLHLYCTSVWVYVFTLKFWANNDHYQSKVFVCVSVIRGAYVDEVDPVLQYTQINIKFWRLVKLVGWWPKMFKFPCGIIILNAIIQQHLNTYARVRGLQFVLIAYIFRCCVL